MTHRAISATLLLLCAATPAYGADLKFSVGGAVEYDDNVFRRERDTEDDILFRIRPGARIEEKRGDDLNFSLGYAIPFEFALDNNSELRDEDHIADGNFTYRVNDQLEFFGRDEFGYLRSTLRRETTGTGGLEGGVPTVSDERERVTRNDGQLGMIYRFSPRTVARLIGSSDLFDPTRDDRSRVYSVGSVADLQYRLSLKHQVGGGVGYTFQDFDDRDFFAGSQTNTYRAFASWRWTIDETLSLEVRAGPSYLTQDQNSSPLVRSEFAVPFTVVSGPVTAFDATGTTLSTRNVGPGSLLVASYLANPGGGTGVNCNRVNGEVVVQGCNQNIVLDSNDAGDQAAINAIANQVVPVFNDDPSGDDGSNLTVFGEATIAKTWSPTLSTALSYSRNQGSASGLGSTVVVDAVTLANTWDFWDRWELSLRGDFTYRESVFDSEETFNRAFVVMPADLGLAPGAFISLAGVCDPATGCSAGSSFNADSRSEIETIRWSAAARITHRLFRHTSLFGQFRYDEQDSDSNSLGSPSDFENFLVTFGVNHSFEPIKLW
jgi:hypothetical protein